MRIIKSAFVIVYTSTIAFASASGFNFYNEADGRGPVVGLQRTLSFADWRERGIERDEDQYPIYTAAGQPKTFDEKRIAEGYSLLP